MESLRNSKAVVKWQSGRSKIGFTPDEIDPDAVKILNDAGFVWDSHTLGFRRSTGGRPAEAFSTVDLRFMRDQKLVVPSPLSKTERTGQLQRLRILIQSMD
jgi:hypothetical protein